MRLELLFCCCLLFNPGAVGVLLDSTTYVEELYTSDARYHPVDDSSLENHDTIYNLDFTETDNNSDDLFKEQNVLTENTLNINQHVSSVSSDAFMSVYHQKENHTQSQFTTTAIVPGINIIKTGNTSDIAKGSDDGNTDHLRETASNDQETEKSLHDKHLDIHISHTNTADHALKEVSQQFKGDQESNESLDISTDEIQNKFVSFEDWKNRKLQDEQDKETKLVSESNTKKHIYTNENNAGVIGEEMELDFDYLTSTNSNQDVSSLSADSSMLYAEDEGKIYKKKFNFASLDCAATIVASNKEAQSAMSILQENKDKSLLFPCNLPNPKFVVIELCEDILVEEIEIANFEFFSSTFDKIRVMVSDRYPVLKQTKTHDSSCVCDNILTDISRQTNIEDDKSLSKDRQDECCTGGWRVLGEYHAEDTMSVQKFSISTPQIWAKYLKLEILTHHGDEFYCPISVLRVHGKTMMDKFKQEEHIYYEEQQKQHVAMVGVAKGGEPTNSVNTESFSDGTLDNQISDTEEEDMFVSNNLLQQYRSNVFQPKNNSTVDEPTGRYVCVAKLPYVGFDDFLKTKGRNTTALTQSSSSGTPYTGRNNFIGNTNGNGLVGEESIFKNIMKRLNVLENNASLSILYLEEESRMLSESFSKLESKYAQIMEEVVFSINLTMTTNIEIMNQIVENIRLSNEINIETEMDHMRNEIGFRLNELKRFEAELSFVKSLMYGVIITFGFLLVYVLVTREAYLMSDVNRRDSDEWYDNGGSASPFIRANKKLWGKMMTPPVPKPSNIPSGRQTSFHTASITNTGELAQRHQSVNSLSSSSSDQYDTGDVVSIGSDIDM